MKSITQDALVQYLIPDLADMVLEYCWLETDDYDYWDNRIYGNYEKIKRLQSSGYTLLSEKVFYFLCQEGYTKIISLCTPPYICDKLLWNDGFQRTCEGGHMKTIKLMIDYAYAHDVKIDWNNAIEISCREGHTKIAKMLIQEKEFKYYLYRNVIGKIKIACSIFKYSKYTPNIIIFSCVMFVWYFYNTL